MEFKIQLFYRTYLSPQLQMFALVDSLEKEAFKLGVIAENQGFIC
jgi:hypothetical protein